MDKIRPDTKNKHDTPDAYLTFFSTNLPPNAADMPKKKIARENANYIEGTEHPITSAMSPFRRLQQYTLPIQE